MKTPALKQLNTRVAVIVLALTVTFYCLLVLLTAAPARAEVWHEHVGNEGDVRPQLAGPVYVLGGGRTDVTDALQEMIDQVRGCQDCSKKVDFVILRFLEDNDQADWDRNREEPDIEGDYLGYQGLFPSSSNDGPKLQGLDSIETFVFSNPARQDIEERPDIAEAIEKAEVVFLAGGDQCKYTRNFKKTDVEAAIESVQARGGAIGGNSAGAAIQGEWIFNACSDEVSSDDALADPYEDILFTENLFHWSALEGTIVDTHFYKRDRMGRAMTFVARLLRDGITDRALAIGIDEYTSLLIDKAGVAQVMANDGGFAYFILGDHQPEVCERNTSLSFSNNRIWRVREGETFDLKNIPTTGDYEVSVSRGRMSPANPY
jgi:cyanophycinase-like exopeptidase